MPIITLTTDFQERDYYAGALKGTILRHCPEATVVDVSHAIEPFNIMHGAFVVMNSWKEFPEETIHLIGVNEVKREEEQSPPRFLLVPHRGHYFLAPDNGILSLILDDQPEQIYVLKNKEQPVPPFPLKERAGVAAGKLAHGFAVDDLAEPADEMEELTALQPVIQEDFIQGSIIHVDAYKNAVSNISRSLFEKVGAGKQYRIYYSRKESIDTLSDHYDEVPEGEVVCLFGASGMLEVAMNKAPASDLLGLEVGDPVQIEFS